MDHRAALNSNDFKQGLRFYLSHVAVPPGIFVLLLAMVEAANLDRRLPDLFYDPAPRTLAIVFWFVIVAVYERLLRRWPTGSVTPTLTLNSGRHRTPASHE